MQVPYLTRVAFSLQVVFVATVSPVMLRAQQFPDGAALLKQSADAFLGRNAMANSKDVVVTGVSTGIGWPGSGPAWAEVADREAGDRGLLPSQFPRIGRVAVNA